jgi:hypothetical protein
MVLSFICFYISPSVTGQATRSAEHFASRFSTGTGRYDVWEIAVPNQSAETLSKEALDE